MELPDFLMALPSLDVPFDKDVVETRAMRTDDALLVFFFFHRDFDLPSHSHKAQCGTVLRGELSLTIGGETALRRPGDWYNIPSGVSHSATIKAGSIVMDAFEEPDRYPLLRRD